MILALGKLYPKSLLRNKLSHKKGVEQLDPIITKSAHFLSTTDLLLNLEITFQPHIQPHRIIISLTNPCFQIRAEAVSWHGSTTIFNKNDK